MENLYALIFGKKMRKINTPTWPSDKNKNITGDVTIKLWSKLTEGLQHRFPIKENIESPESIEKIKNAFSFYENEILPIILNNPNITQQREWYHGLYTHTQNVVFRGICYAISLGKDPIPVAFACACHDLARKDDNRDTEHWKNAVPIAKEIMNNEKFSLTEEQKLQIVDAVANHTEWKETPNYVAACLWDADRTRLSWERWYHEDFFNTELWKRIASWKREDFVKFQNQCVNLEWKDPDTITPEEFNLMLMDRNDIKYFDEHLKERHTFSQLYPEMIPLYDKIVNLPRIQELPEEARKSFLERLFSNIAQHCDIDACMEIIPSLINEGYDLDIIERLSIRENNKTIIKLILDDKEIVELLNKKIEKNKNTYRTIPDEMETISRIVTIDNFKYLKNCLKLNVDTRWLSYFKEDTSNIIQKYLSWYEDYSWGMWKVLDRIHRKWQTLQSIRNIFDNEQITPLTERLLEFKDFDKFKNIWIDEYKYLSTEDKKIFLNGFISALTPTDIKYPEQSRRDENFHDLQKKMKIFKELNWVEDRDERLNSYNDIIRKLLNGIPYSERCVCNDNNSFIKYREGYREKNRIPPMVDDLEKVLDIRTETIKWRTMKVAEVDLKTDLWICTHTFVSILSIEALEITDSQMFLSVWNNWCWKNEIPTFTRKWWYYNLLLKPRKIDDMYVQASCDIDSWNWAMKNLYNFEHIMLPCMWDHCECISLIPNAIKKELNLSQEQYTKRIEALWNVTTLQEVWEKDKELEVATRRVLKSVKMYEWLMTPTVMWISIWKKDLREVDDDILDYCVRRDIPLVKIKYPIKEEPKIQSAKWWEYVV